MVNPKNLRDRYWFFTVEVVEGQIDSFLENKSKLDLDFDSSPLVLPAGLERQFDFLMPRYEDEGWVVEKRVTEKGILSITFSEKKP